MSSLRDLVTDARRRLRPIETIVTAVTGERRSELEPQKVLERARYGYVLDHSPDDVPAMVLRHLYVGSAECTAPRVLETYHIGAILNVGPPLRQDEDEEDDRLRMDGLSRRNVPCLDLPETDLSPVLDAGLPFIREALKRRVGVLVHCNAGVSRSVAVVAGFLIVDQGMSCQEALDHIRRVRPAARPNDGFMRQLNQLQHRQQQQQCRDSPSAS